MRKDLESLLQPIERAKHARRRAALGSRYALGSLLLLCATATLIFEDGDQLIAAAALFACGLATIAFQVSRLARMAEPVPPEWLLLAVECRLSCEGRRALTPMLMAGPVSCDEALDWGQAERGRLVDTLRETALCSQVPIP